MKNWLLLVFCTLFSCKQKTLQVGEGNLFDIQRNVIYGTDKRQVFDFYAPQNKVGEKPVFIMVHGGGWRGGNKEDIISLMYSIMEKFPDHVFANMNYQLAGGNVYALPTQTENILQVMSKINELTKMKNKFILVGASSGAHISMMTAYEYDTKRQVDFVVNIVGPSDLSDEGFAKYPDIAFVRKYLIDPKSTLPTSEPIDSASPVFWLSDFVPTISFYGNQDDVVPISQKQLLDEAFSKTKIKNESYEFNGKHTDFNSKENEKMIAEKIKKFSEKL